MFELSFFHHKYYIVRPTLCQHESKPAQKNNPGIGTRTPNQTGKIAGETQKDQKDKGREKDESFAEGRINKRAQRGVNEKQTK